MRVETDLKNVQHWVDHLGRKRSRVRKYIDGKRRVLGELPVDTDPASPEFQACYHAILRGQRPADAVAAVTARGGSGTVRNFIERYTGSTTFNEYEETTKAMRRSILASVVRLVGNLPADKMDATWIERWLETAPTKGVKRTRLLALKPFTAWASSPAIALMTVDPCAGIRVKVKETSGHHTWTDEEIAQYRARHPVGSMARLALELMLAIGVRRGDAIRLGRQHLKDGSLIFTAEKNRKRKPVLVEVPVPIELATAIAACPSPDTALTFLRNAWDRPFSKKGFGDWFREQVAAAGLPTTDADKQRVGHICTPHGLRKGKGRIMAENDCTSHEIMAVLGHHSLKEAERYTRAFDRKKSAARAQAKLANASNVVPLAVVGGTGT